MGLLRFILAAAIVLWHGGTIAGYRFIDPEVAIHAFYIISGFYMAFILQEKYTGIGSYKTFLSNRLLRIYPAYYAVLLLTLITFPLLKYLRADTLLDPLIGWSGVPELIANLTIVGSSTYFTMNARDPVPLIVPPAWTLGLELLWYAVAPFVVRLRLRYLVPLTIGSIVLRKALLYPRFISGGFVPNRFIAAEICFFLIGVASYAVCSRFARTRSAGIRPVVWVTVVAVTLTYPYIVLSAGYVSVVEWGYYALIASAMPWLFYYTKQNRMDRVFGELSYPVYLSNMFVIWLLKPLFHGRFGTLSSAVFLGATILFSWVLVVAIDRPVNRYRQAHVRTDS